MDTVRKMVFVLGLPGAGKSTFLSQHIAPAFPESAIISFDTLRQALGHRYHANTEPQVNAYAAVMAQVAFMNGQNVYVDESITTPGLAMDLVKIGREFHAEITMVHVGTPVTTCRANRVPHCMSEAEFDRKLNEWQMWGHYILSLADTVKNYAHRTDSQTESFLECEGYV